MGLTTKIETCDSTVNPTAGCNGCELWNHRTGGTCYAAGIHNRFRAKKPGAPSPYPRAFHVVENRPGRMAIAAGWSDLTGKPRPDKPWLDGLPRVVFISDMADAFCEQISWVYLRQEVLGAVRGRVLAGTANRHFWLWFTKRPAMARLFARWLQQVHHEICWPENLMLVASATDQNRLKSRARELLSIPCRFKGLSLEPFHGPVNLRAAGIGRGSIDWIIAGGNSDRRGVRIEEETVRSLRVQCLQLQIPLFFKQWGYARTGREIDGDRIEEMMKVAG